MKPVFICIGAQKCATTWLYHILDSHPDIGLGEAKEVNFFSCHFDCGYQWYERQLLSDEYQLSVGEISTSYFCDPRVPERLFRYHPAVKILLLLRDPVQRALSNHRHEVHIGHFTGTDLSFEAGLANNPMYVEQGMYATHLKRWLQFFPAEQIHVVLVDDIEKDPFDVVEKIYLFLGVDTSCKPEFISGRFNKSYAIRFRLLENLKESIYNLTRIPVFNKLWNFADMLGFKALYRRVNKMSSNQVIPAPHEDTLTELSKQFAPEVQELSELIGRPLSGWLK